MRIIFFRKQLLTFSCFFLAVIFLSAVILSPQVHIMSVPVVADPGEKPVYCVQTDLPRIAISFDASWGADYTLQLLDTLDLYGVDATFFLVSMWVEVFPDLTREIAARGYEIGLHSATHPHFTGLTADQINAELEDNYCIIAETAGVFPTVFRPPFGDYDSAVTVAVRCAGYEVIQWSIDSLDWQGLSADAIVKRVTRSVKNGDIILFHNNGAHTAEALPVVLDYLLEQGFEICSVSALLPDGDYFVDCNGVAFPI